MAALTEIRNIGPATAEALTQAGIPTAEALREIGAEAAYARLLQSGTRPHFIGFYVLVMALQGRPWNDARGAEKTALRATFDQLVKDNPATPAPAADGLSEDLAAALDAIGVRPHSGK